MGNEKVVLYPNLPEHKEIQALVIAFIEAMSATMKIKSEADTEFVLSVDKYEDIQHDTGIHYENNVNMDG